MPEHPYNNVPQFPSLSPDALEAMRRAVYPTRDALEAIRRAIFPTMRMARDLQPTIMMASKVLNEAGFIRQFYAELGRAQRTPDIVANGDAGGTDLVAEEQQGALHSGNHAE